MGHSMRIPASAVWPLTERSLVSITAESWQAARCIRGHHMAACWLSAGPTLTTTRCFEAPRGPPDHKSPKSCAQLPFASDRGEFTGEHIARKETCHDRPERNLPRRGKPFAHSRL